jgi:polysaccharide export outer membrane protein
MVMLALALPAMSLAQVAPPPPKTQTPPPPVAQAPAPAQAAAPGQNEYIIGALDVLAIAVYGEADLTGKFTVEADGSFTYPMVGRVKAAGLSLRQFEAELKNKLADGYFKNPQVSVSVDTYRSQQIFVVGEVRNPGAYPLTGGMTLIEAIARAGSVTASSAPEVTIVRAPAGVKVSAPMLPGEQPAASETLRVNIDALQSGALKQTISLHDGDTVYVPRAETIYVLGQVRNPGAYALRSSDTTVLQALALAGGVNDRGASNRVKIARIVKGEKREVKVKLTDLVLPGDTIIVPDRYF